MTAEREPVSIVIFAYNEEANLEPVLNELLTWLIEHEPDAEIVFVDDGSTDATLETARALLSGFRAQFLRHERNRGIGAALKTGVTQARSPWITFLPADGQIPPHAIGLLRAQSPNADVVLSVYDHRDDGVHRKVLSWGVRTLILASQGVRLRSDGPYFFRRELFVPEQLPSDSFFLNFEFPIRVLSAGLRVNTVTVPCRPRYSGKSKSTALRHISHVAWDLMALRIRRFRGR